MVWCGVVFVEWTHTWHGVVFVECGVVFVDTLCGSAVIPLKGKFNRPLSLNSCTSKLLSSGIVCYSSECGHRQ